MRILNYFIDFNYPEPIPRLEEAIRRERNNNRLLYIREQNRKGGLLAPINKIAAETSFNSVVYIITLLLVLVNVILFNLYLSQLYKIFYSLLSCLIASLIILFWEILYFSTDIKIQRLDYKKVMQRYLRRDNIVLSTENIVLSTENIDRETQRFENTKNELKRKSNTLLDLSRLYCENFITIFGGSLLVSGFFDAFMKLKFNDMMAINPFGTLFICSLPLSLKYLGEVKNPVNMCDKAIQALEEIKNNILT